MNWFSLKCSKLFLRHFAPFGTYFNPPPPRLPPTHTQLPLTQLVAVMQDVRLAQYYQTHTCMNLKQKCQNACIYYKFHLALWKQLIASFVRITNCNTKFCKSYRAFIGSSSNLYSIFTCSCVNGTRNCFSVTFQYLRLLAAVSMIKQTAFREPSLRKNFVSDKSFSAAIHMIVNVANFREDFRKNKFTAKHQNVWSLGRNSIWC